MVRDRAYAKVLVSAAHCVRVGCHPFLLSGGVRFAGRTVPDLLNAKDFVKVGLRVCAILNLSSGHTHARRISDAVSTARGDALEGTAYLPFKILQGAHTSDLICFLDTCIAYAIQRNSERKGPQAIETHDLPLSASNF